MSADLGTMLKGLFSKGKSSGGAGKENPYLKFFIAGGGVALVVVVYLIFVAIPNSSELSEKSTKVSEIGSLTEQINEVEGQQLLAGKELSTAQIEFDQMSKRFFGPQDLDKLYRYISRLALTHKIMVAKLAKLEDKPILQADAVLSDEGEGGAQKVVAYYRLLVQLDASGDFLGWVAFRRDLTMLDKIIVIEEERITILKDEKTQGRINVKITLAVFRWPENKEEKFVSEMNSGNDYE